MIDTEALRRIGETFAYPGQKEIVIGAADEIARLTECCAAYKGQVEALTAALQPFATMADQVEEWQKGDSPNFCGTFNADDLRRARDLINQRGTNPAIFNPDGTLIS